MLEASFEQLLSTAFEGRILPLDDRAARLAGELMAERRSLGRPLSLPDGYIAAIARANGGAVATRNVEDFEACGVTVINPFETSGRP